MSTAQEIAIKMEAAWKGLDQINRKIMAPITDQMYFLTFGREVCSRRARAIRKRGDQVRFYRFASTGKARYLWMPSIKMNR